MNLTEEQVQDFYKQYMEQRLPEEQIHKPRKFELEALFHLLVDEWVENGLVVPEGFSLSDAPDFFPENTYDYLHALHHEVDAARKAAVLHGELPTVYVGAVNRGSYNAEQRPIPLGGGAIILLDAGLLSMSYIFSKILFEATPYFIFKKNVELPGLGIINSSSQLSGMKEVSAGLNEVQLIEQLEFLIESTLSGDPRKAPHIPSRLGGPYMDMPSAFSEACTKFIIGHELGHLVEREIGLDYEFDGFDALSLGQLEEYRCDLFAINIQFQIFKQKYSSANDKTQSMQALLELVAPLHLFDLWTLPNISKYLKSQTHTIPYKSHPPFALRKDKIVFEMIRLIITTMPNHEKVRAEFIELVKMLSQHVNRYIAMLHRRADVSGIDMTNFKYTQV